MSAPSRVGCAQPQREGGGNNLFDEALVRALEGASARERQAFVLMGRLRTARHLGALVRAGRPTATDELDTELGTFGFALGDARALLDADQRGHLMRTKPARDREGGTIKGSAGHDAPLLLFGVGATAHPLFSPSVANGHHHG